MTLSSLRSRLRALIVMVLAAVLLPLGLLSVKHTLEEVDELSDGRLAQAARTLEVLVGRIGVDELRQQRQARLLVPSVSNHPPELTVQGRTFESEVGFQVFDRDGTLLLATENLASVPNTHAPDGAFENIRKGKYKWRVFTLIQEDDGITIRAGERYDSRNEITRALWIEHSLPMLLGLPLMAFLVGWAIRRGLRPLNELAQALSQRKPGGREPVHLEAPPAELQPVLSALNGQIGQLVLAGAQLDPNTLQVVKPGQVPNDLLDRRDLLLDNLGKLANITSVTYDDQNRATVVVAGLTAVTPTGGATPITRAQVDAQFTSGALTGGALHGLEDAYQNMLNEASATSYPSQLNVLAQSLHDAVNAQHALGADLNGNAGGAFFTGTDATDIAVNAAVVSNPALIAASATGAAGDAGNALKMADMQTTPTIGSATIDAAYTQLVTQVGADVQQATNQVDTTTALTNALQNQRQSVSGVSLDEEMTNLISFQQAYSASARFITTISSLYNTLVNETQ